jgi:hypothetical protein
MIKMGKISIILAVGTSALVAGCQYFNSKLPDNPPSQREQICSDLKRQIVFSTTQNTNMATAPVTERAEAMRLYDKNNCSEFDGKK